MERMVEEIKGSEYESMQHFISNSPWDSQGLMRQLSRTASKELEPFGMKGCTVDEKSHLKKGDKSVGVARQYAGTIGKVENCQVGVYLSLCAGKYALLTNHRLYLPEEWTKDKERCKKAGIPDDRIVFKTKPQLALEMIKEHIEYGVRFDYVNGDGLYGNGYEFSKGLSDLGQKYVLDVHSNQRIYLQKPMISVPEKQEGKKGRKPARLKTNIQGITVSEYYKQLNPSEYSEVDIRKTTKGWLRAKVHIVEIWVWDESNGDKEAIKQTLVIRKPINKKDNTKYSLSNIPKEAQSIQMFAFMQAQRFWIERCFKDDSHDLGMSDYQVRTYKGWNNHMSLTCVAMQFVLRQRIRNSEIIPLLSYNDVRILLAEQLINESKGFSSKIDQMIFRHKQRKKDIDRYYTKESFFDLPK
jgi:SRSO17 transposase